MSTQTRPSDTPSFTIGLSVPLVARICLIGGVIGLASVLIGLLLQQFVFGPLLCSDGYGCQAAVSYSQTTTVIISVLTGLFLLVAQRTYRPLMIVVGITVALWGLYGVAFAVPMLGMILLYALIHSAAYGVFTIAGSLRNFYLSLALTAVIAVATRLIISL